MIKISNNNSYPSSSRSQHPEQGKMVSEKNSGSSNSDSGNLIDSQRTADTTNRDPISFESSSVTSARSQRSFKPVRSWRSLRISSRSANKNTKPNKNTPNSNPHIHENGTDLFSSVSVAIYEDAITNNKHDHKLPTHGCLKLRTQKESVETTYGATSTTKTTSTTNSTATNEEDENKGENHEESNIADSNSDTNSFRHDTNSSSTRTHTIKSVQWKDICFHVHTQCLGDNPSVTNGPPVALSWEKLFSKTVAIDDYETSCSELPKRDKFQMLLPRDVREDALYDLGYSFLELKEMEADVLLLQKQLKKSAATYYFFNHGYGRIFHALFHVFHIEKKLNANKKKKEKNVGF